MNSQNVQSRSSSNGIHFHKTVKDAYDAYLKDNTIWKISYDDEYGVQHRWVTKTKSENHGKYVDELILNKLSVSYEQCEKLSNQLFWYDQSPEPTVDENTGKIVEFPIYSVVTDQDFATLVNVL